MNFKELREYQKLVQDNKSLQQECNNYLKTIDQYENKIQDLDEKINTLQNMLLNLNTNKHELLSNILSRENACLLEINKYKAIIKEKDRYIAKQTQINCMDFMVFISIDGHIHHLKFLMDYLTNYSMQ